MFLCQGCSFDQGIYIYIMNCLSYTVMFTHNTFIVQNSLTHKFSLKHLSKKNRILFSKYHHHHNSQEAKEELYLSTHPDPYCVPFMPGGSLFMRNPPPPIEVCFPDGNVPADAPTVTLNPDMSVCSPESGRNATGTVLVDFTKKNME